MEIATAIAEKMTFVERKTQFSCGCWTTSNVTPENVVKPPQKPGIRNHRNFVSPRRSVSTSRCAAKAAPMKFAAEVA
jgi:hypothetical protein